MTKPDEPQNDTETGFALLRKWVETRSEAAFRCLVETYAPLVWGAAMRKTGDRDMAAEATQQVFTDLAVKAPVLVARQRPLAPWLHRSATFEAVQILRRELRHRDRMKRYAAGSGAESGSASGHPPAPDPWEDIAPHLDDALDALSGHDRRILLLHWFERRIFADIAARLGCSPAAAQRRGFRALEKLASSLRRRGATVSGTLLATGLAAQLAPTAPAAATMAACSSAVAAATAGPATAAASTILTLQKSLAAMASAKLTTAAVVLIFAALPVGIGLARREAGHTGGLDAVSSASALPRPAAPASSASAATPSSFDLSIIQAALDRLMSHPDDYQTHLELRRLLLSLSAAEISVVQPLLDRHFTTIAHSKDGSRSYPADLGRCLFARWAELDPAAATQAALATYRTAWADYPLRGAFLTWASTDLEAAWAWMEKNLPEIEIRKELGATAFSSLVSYAKDVTPLLARIDSIQDRELRDHVWNEAVKTWVNRTAPNDVLQWALHLPPGPDREERIATAFEAGSITRPEAYLGYLNHIENPARRIEAARNILGTYLPARHPDMSISPPDFYDDLPNLTKSYPVEIFALTGEGIAQHGAQWALKKMHQLPAGAARDEFIQGTFLGVPATEAAQMLPALALLGGEMLTLRDGPANFLRQSYRQSPRATAEWIAALPEDSPARPWAEDQFQSVAGRSAAAFLQSPVP